MKNTQRFSLREMEHISTNYAITVMKGYKGSFMEYFNDIKFDWRSWLKAEDKRRKIVK